MQVKNLEIYCEFMFCIMVLFFIKKKFEEFNKFRNCENIWKRY